MGIRLISYVWFLEWMYTYTNIGARRTLYNELYEINALAA